MQLSDVNLGLKWTVRSYRDKFNWKGPVRLGEHPFWLIWRKWKRVYANLNCILLLTLSVSSVSRAPDHSLKDTGDKHDFSEFHFAVSRCTTKNEYQVSAMNIMYQTLLKIETSNFNQKLIKVPNRYTLNLIKLCEISFQWKLHLEFPIKVR